MKNERILALSASVASVLAGLLIIVTNAESLADNGFMILLAILLLFLPAITSILYYLQIIKTKMWLSFIPITVGVILAILTMIGRNIFVSPLLFAVGSGLGVLRFILTQKAEIGSTATQTELTDSSKKATVATALASLNVKEIVNELTDRKDQKVAKIEPLWAFVAAWAINIASWLFFIKVGAGAINLIPMIICFGAVAIAVLYIRPAKGKWKYVTIASIFDTIWMLVWVFI